MLYFPSRLYNRVCIFSTFYRGWIKRDCTTALVSLIQPRLITFFLLVHFNALGQEYHFFKTILEKLRSKWESLPYKNENVKKCQIWCFYVKRRHRRTLISCNLHLQHHNTIIVAVHKGGGKENFNWCWVGWNIVTW